MAKSKNVKLNHLRLAKRKGQVAIFVIIALVIVAGIAIFFVVRDSVGSEDVPLELSSVFDYYLSCIEQETRNVVELAGVQGGHVELPDYYPGSEYAPFSSHLNFLGNGVPYWYYISGNGVIKEQVLTKAEIEKEMEDYVESALEKCELEFYHADGFDIQKGEDVNVDIKIEDRRVVVLVNSDLEVSKGEDRWRKSVHNAEIDSRFGEFYNSALEIYNVQKEEAFFEGYARDVLYSYAPVDGVEIQCGPKLWSTQNVANELKEGLEENFRTIKFKGNYYNLLEKEREYFVIDKEVGSAVNVVYSKSWPTKVEVQGEGVDDEIMIAEAVGTQEGLGVMGFCYVPYHFVYDVSFPVLIQLYDNEELFQFPVVVVLDNNVPREAVFSGNLGVEEELDLCEFETQEVEVELYNVNLNKIDGRVSYECFNQRCDLGESRNGKLRSVAPACVNGYLHVRAEGYADKKQLFSSNEQSFAEIVLEREHDVEIELLVGGRKLDGTAIVSFVREDGKSVAASLPGTESVKLSEGSYDIKVYVYGNSSVVIPASKSVKCVEVPKEGLLGFLGGTREECFDINIPQTKLDYALIGGGESKSYLLESEIEKGHVAIRVDRLPTPTTLNGLQENFELFSNKNVRLDFG